MLDDYNDNPNVTAILWAGAPGQESENSITDVLYRRVNPGAKLLFILAKTRRDYGPHLLYTPNYGDNAPQIAFTEGVFIGYRSLDQRDVTPIYEFGYGLSYTSFFYSDIKITKAAGADHPYIPTTGSTPPAPASSSLAPIDTSLYTFPSNLTRIYSYVYPYLNETDLAVSANTTGYGHSSFIPPNSQNGSPQSLLPASGPSGGNPQLYDVLYQVTAAITNTGKRAGDKVVQMYISLGGEYNPKIVLRGL